MNDKLRILITAGLNEGLSVGQINSDLRKIASDPKLQNLKIGIEIDKKVLEEVSRLSTELNKATQSLREQSDVAKKYKVDTDQSTSAVNQHAEATKKAIAVGKEWRVEQEKISQVTGKSTTILGNVLNPNVTQTIKEQDGDIVDVVDSRNHKKQEQDLLKLQNRISSLVTEIQRFNRAGKELPVGKGKELDNLLHTLRNIDTKNITKAHQELDKVERTLKRLDSTANARTGLLKQLDSMRLEGVVDPNRISQLETRIRKAESPEQIRVLAKEYGNLRKEQTKILQVEEKKPALLQQVQTLREKEIITEKQSLALKKEIEALETRSGVRRLQDQVSDIENNHRREMANLNARHRLLMQIKAMERDPIFRRRRPELEDFRNQLMQVGLTSQGAKLRIDELGRSVRELGMDVRSAGIKTSTMVGAFQNAMIKFPIWMGASTARRFPL